MTIDPKHTRTGNVQSVEDEEDSSQVQSDRTVQIRDVYTAPVLEALPPSVKRRIKALKKLQLATTNIEAEFYEEVHKLECKYFKRCGPSYEKRCEIISGLVEPTDEECQWESEDEEESLTNDLKTTLNVDSTEKKESPEKDDVKGIPDFWLTIFRNVGMLAEMVEEHDEPILKHLYDIKVIFLESDPMGYVLEFHFEPNEYFSNSVLTKEYIMKCTPDKDDPLNFEGPEIYKSKGCIIDWKKGKNVTVKTIKKNQMHKSRGSRRTVTKIMQNDSFFNFFSPPIVPEDAELDDETQALLTSDFEIGHYFRERIVPRAVLYYTGEQLEDEDEDYEEEEEEDIDVDDEEEDEDGSTPKVTSGGKRQDPNECKSQ